MLGTDLSARTDWNCAMPYVRTVEVDAADGAASELYEKELAEDGEVSNMTRLFSLRADALRHAPRAGPVVGAAKMEP
jgi:hypothetical protein